SAPAGRAGGAAGGGGVRRGGPPPRRSLGSPRVKVSDASVLPLWQQVSDLEELPGPRLTFTTAANTPDAIAFLSGRPVAERLVFHAPCGRLHLWPVADESPALLAELAGEGFGLIGARRGALPGAPPGARRSPRARPRRALDPEKTFALGGSWVERGSTR